MRLERKTDIKPKRKDKGMFIIYSFVGSFLALVVYNLFGGKQFVEKKIKESQESVDKK